ncbi:dUTP diphosphatase [Candidatus Woesearchaeota archaeon]|nr:dUTP diphosphatase [Candidatus Woesearchaeota archaeon]
MVDVRILKLQEDMTLPGYAHPGDAGIDLRSAEELTLKPGEFKIVKTGTKMAIPQGYVGLVWDKSGYAAKHGIHTLAGVIDSGYRGEIGIVMKNLGEEEFHIAKDMKIAQLLIQPVVTANLIESDNLDETSRNEGGFGSTGKH